jgi:hypothetical protein
MSKKVQNDNHRKKIRENHNFIYRQNFRLLNREVGKVFSFTQKIRMGWTFYRLYTKYSLVRMYTSLLLPFAPHSYRQLPRLLNF